MKTDVEMDMTEFNRALKELSERTSRTFPEFMNGQMFAVANKALQTTEKANADAIAVAMGQIATKSSVSKKTGKRRTVRVYRTDVDSFAARIVNARLIKSGKKMIFGDALDKAARKMIASRLRSVAFIKSGWIWAMRDLSKIIPGLGRYSERVSARGSKKGSAMPVTRWGLSGGSYTGQIENTSLLTASKFGSGGNPMPVATAGLQRALNIVAKDMMEHLAKKLKPIFDSVSAKR